MQKYNATVISTTGAPGTGKTYSRCARFLYDWWLPEEKGVHWSNFPVKVDAFLPKFPDAAERIKIIPDEELKNWALCDGEHGPWKYFDCIDLQGAHIAIDECHNFLRRQGRGAGSNAERWQRWLGEIRHRGCTVEFLSQDPHKVHAIVEQHAAVRIQLVNSEDRRDPILGCLLGDWYEVRAAFTREYETVIWQLEQRRINGKWTDSDFSRFTLDPRYFALYDSFNTPQSGGTKASGQERVFEKRGRLGVLFWFVKRNVWRLASRFAIACGIIWLCFFGGMMFCFDKFNGMLQRMATANGGKPMPGVEGSKPSASASVPEPMGAPKESVKRPKPSAAPLPESRPMNPPVIEAPVTPSAPVAVRSETMKHQTLEAPPSGEVQQQTLPRLLWLSPDSVALDDGTTVQIGERAGTFVLRSVDFKKRVGVFEGSGDDASTVLVVPVGGPVGVRVRKKSAAEQSRPEIAVPSIVP